MVRVLQEKRYIVDEILSFALASNDSQHWMTEPHGTGCKDVGARWRRHNDATWYVNVEAAMPLLDEGLEWCGHSLPDRTVALCHPDDAPHQ